MTPQTPSTIPSEYYKNVDVLKSMQNSLPLVYDVGPEGKSGKNRINVEITLMNELVVRREIDYIWIEDPYGLTIDAKVLGSTLPCYPWDLEKDIQHHIEELHLTRVINITVK